MGKPLALRKDSKGVCLPFYHQNVRHKVWHLPVSTKKTFSFFFFCHQNLLIWDYISSNCFGPWIIGISWHLLHTIERFCSKSSAKSTVVPVFSSSMFSTQKLTSYWLYTTNQTITSCITKHFVVHVTNGYMNDVAPTNRNSKRLLAHNKMMVFVLKKHFIFWDLKSFQ